MGGPGGAAAGGICNTPVLAGRQLIGRSVSQLVGWSVSLARLFVRCLPSLWVGRLVVCLLAC